LPRGVLLPLFRVRTLGLSSWILLRCESRGRDDLSLPCRNVLSAQCDCAQELSWWHLLCSKGVCVHELRRRYLLRCERRHLYVVRGREVLDGQGQHVHQLRGRARVHASGRHRSHHLRGVRPWQGFWSWRNRVHHLSGRHFFLGRIGLLQLCCRPLRSTRCHEQYLQWSLLCWLLLRRGFYQSNAAQVWLSKRVLPRGLNCPHYGAPGLLLHRLR